MPWLMERLPDSEQANDLVGLALVLLLAFAVAALALLQRLARGAARALPVFAVLSLKPTTTLLLGVGALWLVLALTRQGGMRNRQALLFGVGALGLGLLVGAWQPRLLLPLASALTLLAYVAAWCHWAGRRAAAAVLGAVAVGAALIAWELASSTHVGLSPEVRVLDVLTLSAPVLFAAMVWVTPPLCWWRGSAVASSHSAP
jgi:hypothetical protein